METPRDAVATGTPGGRGPFRGVRALVGTGAAAAATVPQGPARALLALALLSAWTGAPWLAVTAVAAFAATSSLRRLAVVGLGISLALFVAALVRSRESSPDAAVACGLVTLACALGSVHGVLRRRRRTVGADSRTAFLAAAQRHPWTTTVVVLLVAGIDAWWGVGAPWGGGWFPTIERPIWALAPAAGAAVAVHLTRRTTDPLGRLAPLALGVPLTVVGGGAAIGRALGYSVGVEAAGLTSFLAVVGLWWVAWSYPLPRFRTRVAPPCWSTSLWIVLVIAGRAAWCEGPRETAEKTISAATFALGPFLLVAASNRGSDVVRAVAWGGVVVAASACLPLVEDLGQYVDRLGDSGRFQDPLVTVSVGGSRELDLAAAACEFLLRHAELGMLLAGAGALARRARSLTALPSDHPVFTEGPWVPLPWRAATSTPAEVGAAATG